jgi:tetratricopeptide (TPR) repeat protein
MVAPFVGRRNEIDVLTARLEEARRGQPGIVLIQGPSGIGKTALVDRFLSDADDVRVLRASGDESEALLAYGVVSQLERSAGLAQATFLAETPSPSVGSVEDPVTVGTRILQTLDSLQQTSPIVLVLDDAHWSDQPSLQALTFVLRRLVADCLLGLIVVSDDAAWRLPDSIRRLVTGRFGTVVRLGGLEADDLRNLADAIGIRALPPDAARRIREGTNGHPLHALALLEEVPPADWSRRDSPLPATRSFRLLVHDRLTGCSVDARRLGEAAAVLGLHCPLASASRLGEVTEPLVALDEAVKAGLLSTADGTRPREISFPHPLVRAGAYDTLDPSRQADLHRVAATLMDDEAAALRHRLAAGEGPDQQLAAALARFANREATRQAWSSAAEHLVEASGISPNPQDREFWLLRAVNWMLFAGDVTRAATFARTIRAFPPTPLRDSVLGYLATASQNPARAEDLLRSAWERCSPEEDPELVATVALKNTMHWYGRLHGEKTMEWGRRTLALLAPHSPTRPMAETYYAYGLGYAGRVDQAFAAVARADDPPDAPEHSWLEPRSARGILRLVTDDLDGARADLASTAATAAELGKLNTAAFSFAMLAYAEYLAGAWDDAVLHAERAVAINAESDYEFMHSLVLSVAAAVPAARGDWDTAEALIREGTPRPHSYERSTVAAALASARLAAARADAPGALAALEPVRRIEHRDGVDEPGFWPWQHMYAEALVRVGRVDEADRFLVPHEELAASRGRRSAMARLARARGRVEAAAGRPENAASVLAAGLAASEQALLPFEHAQLQLAYGQILRRGGQRRAAGALLTEASRCFVELGAEPSLDRCALELAACGLPSGSR